VPQPRSGVSLYKTGILFISGILLGRYFVHSLPAFALLCASLTLLEAVLLRLRARSAASIFAAALLVSLGGLDILSDGSAPNIPDSLSLRTVVVAGNVDDIPIERPGGTRFLLQAVSWTDGLHESPLETRLEVSIAKGPGAVKITYGMNILIAGELMRPPREGNPGEFCPREYYAAMGVGGVLYVRGTARIRIRDTVGGSWYMRWAVIPVRAAILRTIDKRVDGEEREFLKDLLLGERSGISEQTRADFLDAGISHILAVSGLRVLLIWAMLDFLYLSLRLPGCIRPVFVCLGLLFYMALTGAHPPVVRATLMAISMLLGRHIGRRANRANLLVVCALIVLSINADQLFDVGFQLSFVAVLSLIHLMPPFQRGISSLGGAGWAWSLARKALRTGAASLVVSLGTFPIVALHFGRVSVIGVLANIVIIPVAAMCVVLGFIVVMSSLISSGISASYGALLGLALHWTLRGAALCAAIPYSAFDTLQFHVWDAIPYYALVGIVFFGKSISVSKRLILVALAGLNVAFFVAPESSKREGLLRLTVINVGQGDAILVEFPHGHTMLVDAGPLALSHDAGRSVVSPFLKRRGISRIDLLVITHWDADHAGGVPYIIRHFGVGHVLLGRSASSSALARSCRGAIAETRCSVDTARTGRIFPLEPAARVYVLWPPAAQPTNPRGHLATSNEGSVVLKILYGNISFLLTADAEAEAEGAMIARYGSSLRSTFLKVAHHGSRSSSSAPFLENVTPSVAGVSVGLHNKFHHPSPEVLSRLEEAHAAIRRTDRDGALILESDGRALWQVDWRSSDP